MTNIRSLRLFADQIYPLQLFTRSLAHIPSSVRGYSLTSIGIVSLALISLIGLAYKQIAHRNYLSQIQVSVKDLIKQYNTNKNDPAFITDEINKCFQKVWGQLEQYRSELSAEKAIFEPSYYEFSEIYGVKSKVERFLQENDFKANLTLLKTKNGLRVGFQILSAELEPYRDHSILRSIVESFEKNKTEFLEMRKIRCLSQTQVRVRDLINQYNTKKDDPAFITDEINKCFQKVWGQLEQYSSELGAEKAIFEPSYYEFSEIYGIKSKVERFLQENDFQANLTLLKNENGLRERFQTLSTELEPYRDHSILRSIVESFEKNKTEFLEMRKFRVELLFVPPRKTSSGNTIIPDDGNCLYEAAAVGLNSMKPSQSLQTLNCQTKSTDFEMSDNSIVSDYGINAQDLREEVVHWMRANVEKDEKLKERIINSICALLYDIDDQIKQELSTLRLLEQEGNDITAQINELMKKKEPFEPYRQIDDPSQQAKAIEHYLNEQAKDKVWGSNAEVYAIAKMKNYEFSIIAVERSGPEGNEIETLLPRDNDSSIAPEEQTLFSDLNGSEKQTLYLKFIKNKSHYEAIL